MVDAGSGWTRVERFSRTADGLVHLDATKRLAPLADVLVAGGDEPERWLSALLALLEDDASASQQQQQQQQQQQEQERVVYIGATAGIRSAITEGTITEERLAQFEALVRRALGERASFAIVSGEDEAALELRAVEYCVRGAAGGGSALLGSGGAGGGGGGGGGGRVGLMSSGGMSSQVVFPLGGSGGGSVCALSLPTKLKKEGNLRCLEGGAAQGLAAYTEYLERVVAAAAIDAAAAAAGAGDSGGKLQGTFVLIEVLGSVGERVGIDRRVLSAAAATEALDRYLAQWLQKAERATAAEVEAYTWKSVVPATSALQARRLLELLDPEAQLYFSRTFELAPGHVLKPSWTLGYALSHVFGESA